MALGWMNRLQDEDAVLLHTRVYRETSLIAQFLTERHGRIAAVAQGVRRRRQGHSLQPFHQGLLSCSGRGGLASLRGFDLTHGRWFKGNQLAMASYLVELIVRLTREWEPVPGLFHAVVRALGELGDDGSTVAAERCLRRFEKRLLEELGYGLDFGRNAGSGERINGQDWYQLEPELGFVPGPIGEGYPGEVLLAIDQECFDAPPTRKFAKATFRALIASHLGPAPLLSRRLYRPASQSHEPAPASAP